MAKKSNSELQRRISKLEQHVKQYRKLDRLDIALLSVSSIFGLVFAAVNYVIGDLASLILIPTLIIAWLMPFYVWFNTRIFSIELIEHVRMWIYFFGGLVFYIIMTVIFLASFYGSLKNLPDLIKFSSFAVISLMVWIFPVNKKLTKRIFRWYGGRVTKKVEKKVYQTGYNAFINATFISAFSGFIYLGYRFYQLYQVLSNTQILAGSILFLIVGFGMLIYGAKNLVSFERSIRRK